MISIERRIQLRQEIHECMEARTAAQLNPIELEELLDHYEHGRFRSGRGFTHRYPPPAARVGKHAVSGSGLHEGLNPSTGRVISAETNTLGGCVGERAVFETEVLTLIEELRQHKEFVIAHTLVDKGVTDFALQNQAVERLRAASEQETVRATITSALCGASQ